jgi:hypothetical protein
MDIYKIKVMDTRVIGECIVIPNDRLIKTGSTPFIWSSDTKGIVIRGCENDIANTLRQLRDGSGNAIKFTDLTAFTAVEDDEYTGYSFFGLDLYMGFGLMYETDEEFRKFYFGNQAILDTVIKSVTGKLKGFLLGELTEFADIISLVVDKMNSEAGEKPGNGELVFLLSIFGNDSMFQHSPSKFSMAETKDGDSANSDILFCEDSGCLKAIQIPFSRILADL